MVQKRLESSGAETERDAFGHLTGRAIDDAATEGLGNLERPLEFDVVRWRATDGQMKVRPREAVDADFGRGAWRDAQAKLPDDVGADGRSCGGGHGQNARAREREQHLAQV